MYYIFPHQNKVAVSSYPPSIISTEAILNGQTTRRREEVYQVFEGYCIRFPGGNPDCYSLKFKDERYCQLRNRLEFLGFLSPLCFVIAYSLGIPAFKRLGTANAIPTFYYTAMALANLSALSLIGIFYTYKQYRNHLNAEMTQDQIEKLLDESKKEAQQTLSQSENPEDGYFDRCKRAAYQWTYDSIVLKSDSPILPPNIVVTNAAQAKVSVSSLLKGKATIKRGEVGALFRQKIIDVRTEIMMMRSGLYMEDLKLTYLIHRAQSIRHFSEISFVCFFFYSLIFFPILLRANHCQMIAKRFFLAIASFNLITISCTAKAYYNVKKYKNEDIGKSELKTILSDSRKTIQTALTAIESKKPLNNWDHLTKIFYEQSLEAIEV